MAINPKRVWSEGFKPTKIANLYPATYERDVAVVQGMLAANEAQAETARRVLQRAIVAGDQIVAASQRRQVERFETYARNCRERLSQLAPKATPVSAYAIAAE
jgi:hypothetical protein